MDYQCVVRVQTEAYKRGATYFYGKSLRVLQKQSTFDLLKEECDSVGITDGIENILNLHKVGDGVYSLVAVNLTEDPETGYTDGWDLKLTPYEEARND